MGSSGSDESFRKVREKDLIEKFTWNGVIPLSHSPGTVCVQIVSKAGSVGNKTMER